MADLLNPELLEVAGRVYRVLGSAGASTSGQRQAQQPHQQHHYEADEEGGGAEMSWGGGGGGAGGGGGGEEEAEASVPIRQEGDAFVARMRLDVEVGSCSAAALGSGCWRTAAEQLCLARAVPPATATATQPRLACAARSSSPC